MKSIFINNDIQIGQGCPTFISVDIGKNHLGSLDLAKYLVLKAKETGVTGVKFQTHVVDDEQRKEHVISPHFNKSRYEWVRDNTMPFEWWNELFHFANENAVLAYSTPMSLKAAELLEKLDIPIFKIGSADVSDLEMIEFITDLKKPVFLSSGMHNMEDLELAVNTIRKKHDNIILMHCVSNYPCPPEGLNIKIMETLHKRFELPVGLSSHALSLPTDFAAVALGAVAIEKHFSLMRDMPGPDHKVSLIPQELTRLVHGIREVKSCLGSSKKSIQNSEEKFIPVFHKSVTSLIKIKKGETLNKEMVTLKRPGGGIYWKDLSKILGKKANRDILADHLLLAEYFI
jgi:sialic acid synthase SpsE